MPAETNLEAIWDRNRCQDHFRCRTTLDDAQAFSLQIIRNLAYQHLPDNPSCHSYILVSTVIEIKGAMRFETGGFSLKAVRSLVVSA